MIKLRDVELAASCEMFLWNRFESSDNDDDDDDDDDDDNDDIWWKGREVWWSRCKSHVSSNPTNCSPATSISTSCSLQLVALVAPEETWLPLYSTSCIT